LRDISSFPPPYFSLANCLSIRQLGLFWLYAVSGRPSAFATGRTSSRPFGNAVAKVAASGPKSEPQELPGHAQCVEVRAGACRGPRTILAAVIEGVRDG
jgi:hypothetical protein